MAAKRKLSSPTPPTLPQIVRLKEFLQLFHDTDQYAPDRSFCFILGSGAALSAGIPTGSSLVNRWLVEMHDTDDACSTRILPPHAVIEDFVDSLLDGEKDRLKKWSEKRFKNLKGFTFENRAAFYGSIYKARFEADPELGQKFLRKLIHRRPPSIGFHLLARILNRSRHKVVITTNFDHLVEDAIAITENEAIQSYNHDGLAQFLKGNADHPAIVKIHGDILLKSFNADEELVDLRGEWKPALRALFQTQTPIISGYGGNDPGFMNFLLEEIRSWPADRRCYWFVRDKTRFASVHRSGELAQIPALRLVECPGFTELMVLLDEIFNYLPLDQELRLKADKIASNLKEAVTKARGEVDAHQRRLRESNTPVAELDSATGTSSSNSRTATAESDRTWQEWRDAILANPYDADKEEMVRKATTAHPQNSPLKAIVETLALWDKPSELHRIQRLRDLLSQSESESGADSEETLSVLNSFGIAHMPIAKYETAESILRRVIPERTRILGPEHPDTLSSRNSLCRSLRFQGKLSEAENELRAVWEIRGRTLGNEHPDTLHSRNDLAIVMRARGQHRDAEYEHRTILEIRKRVLGEQHPDTVHTRNSLANAFFSQGNYSDAEKENRAVLATQEKRAKPNDPDIFLSCYNLALCLERQGKIQEGLIFGRRALEGWEKILSPNHPDLRESRNLVDYLRLRSADWNADDL